MSKKTVPFKIPAAPKPVDQDAWVQDRLGQEPAVAREVSNVTPLVQPTEAIKRLTVDLGEGLHRRIKTQCAGQGVKMSDMIREILEREFPASAESR